MADYNRPLPLPTPETQHFWDGTRNGELRLQRCTACKESYFPPRPLCPNCGSRAVEIYKASGKATLYSYAPTSAPSHIRSRLSRWPKARA